MPKTDEGEFELILGNKQLISVFLIVVVLLGVFFSMGYIVGRNSTAPAAEAARTTVKPAPTDTPPPADTTASVSTPENPPQEPPTKPSDADSKAAGPETTHPQQAAASGPATSAAKPAAKPPAQNQSAASKPSAVGPPASAAVPAPVSREPGNGMYWQVTATSRFGAEVISEALNKKGFHSLLTPVPGKEGFFRVLVGPLADSATQAETRTKLEAAGFKNPVPRRY